MPSTYSLIKGETLASSAASYTFTAIPSTFTDLVLRCSVRTTASGGNDLLQINFNGDSPSSGNKYSQTFLNTPSGSANSDRNSNQPIWYSVKIPANSSTSNTFSSTEMYVPSYTVSQNKPMSIFDVWEQNSTLDADISAHATLWRDTTAVSSIALSPYLTGSFAIGSSFYLYGISKS
jgi:hypothetical protein